MEIKRGEKITFCNGLGGAEGSLIRTGTRERRRRLRKRLIDCCCDRCVDPAELDTFVSGLLCQRCIGQFTNTKKSPLLPADPVDHAGSKWVCGECGYQVRADFAAALEEKLLKELEEDRGEDEHVKLKDFLLTNSAILHPNHFLMTTCKWRLFSMASSIHQSNGAASASEGISIADKMEAAEHGMEMLKLCDKLHPGLSVERGAILLSMATMLQQTLSQEIMNRISHSESSDDSDPESPGCGGELSERQVYAIFRDSQFCFEEAKKVQRLDKTPRGKEVYAGIKSSIHLLNDMKKEFERSYLKVRKKSRE